MEAFFSAYVLGIAALWLIGLVVIFRSFQPAKVSPPAAIHKQPNADPTWRSQEPSWIFAALSFVVYEASVIAVMVAAINRF